MNNVENKALVIGPISLKDNPAERGNQLAVLNFTDTPRDGCKVVDQYHSLIGRWGNETDFCKQMVSVWLEAVFHIDYVMDRKADHMLVASDFECAQF